MQNGARGPGAREVRRAFSAAASDSPAAADRGRRWRNRAPRGPRRADPLACFSRTARGFRHRDDLRRRRKLGRAAPSLSPSEPWRHPQLPRGAHARRKSTREDLPAPVPWSRRDRRPYRREPGPCRSRAAVGQFRLGSPGSDAAARSAGTRPPGNAAARRSDRGARGRSCGARRDCHRCRPRARGPPAVATARSGIGRGAGRHRQRRPRGVRSWQPVHERHRQPAGRGNARGVRSLPRTAGAGGQSLHAAW